MVPEALTKATGEEYQEDYFAGPDTSDRAVNGPGLALLRVQDDLLTSGFWLALGCALGWQDKECYEGEHPEALLESVLSHV